MSETGYYIDAEYDSDYSSMSGSGELHQWQTDPPTEPGLYRAKWKLRDSYEWVMFDGKSVELFYKEVYFAPQAFTHWLGPLPAPEMTK